MPAVVVIERMIRRPTHGDWGYSGGAGRRPWRGRRERIARVRCMQMQLMVGSSAPPGRSGEWAVAEWPAF